MTARAKGSITGRLIMGLTVGTTVLWLLAAGLSSAIMQRALNESFDQAEAETARRLLPLATDSTRDRDESSMDVHEVHQFELNHDRGLVYQLRQPDGRMILRSDDAPAVALEEGAPTGFSNTEKFRVYTLIDPQSGLAIQVGEPLEHRQQAILESTLTLFLPLLLLVPLSALGIWLAIRRGLRPLTMLQAEITARDSANLSPLRVENLPRELTPISIALGRLIDRLRGAFEAERQFAANSAHELRTPIAGALAQTQRLIESTGDERARSEARKIESTLRRLADLAEKLMQLARADAGMAVSEEAITVTPILRLVLADVRSRARPPRDIVLNLPPGAEEWTARINIDALAIVLRNLLDNAVAHSPAETQIEVVVAPDWTIAVRNASPAIAPEALDRLRRRFERGATAASGSGLGLAIVETILSQVGGELSLHSPIEGRADGFEAVVKLP
jgi:two-component system, OmpR family, sensor kinase